MRKSDLETLEGVIMQEVVKRRQLGGYSADAEGILILAETTLRVLQHMIETYPEPKHVKQKHSPNQE